MKHVLSLLKNLTTKSAIVFPLRFFDHHDLQSLNVYKYFLFGFLSDFFLKK